MHGGFRNAVSAGDLAEAQAALTITADGSVVEFERPAPDGTPFQPGSAHAGLDPFDDQAALELRDGADDDDQSAAQRSAGIDVLAEADELDVQPVQLVKDLEQPGSINPD